jgi:hypothetical protein
MRVSFNFRHKLANNIGSPLAVPTGGGYLVKGQTAQPRLHQRAHRSFVLVNATWMLAMSGVPAYSQHSHNASQAASTRPAWSELQRSMGSMHEALSSLKSTGALSAAQTAYIQALEAQLADRTTGTLRRGRSLLLFVDSQTSGSDYVARAHTRAPVRRALRHPENVCSIKEKVGLS